MTQNTQWPVLEDVESADTKQLLDWNKVLPAPAEGTDEYVVLTRIVALLHERRDQEKRYLDHPGWPGPPPSGELKS